MSRVIAVVVIVASVLAGPSAFAQETPLASSPVPEHEWLKKFVGEWDVVSEGNDIRGEAVMKSSMLGDLWLVNSSDHTFPGMRMTSLQLIGYDPDKQKYVGIWTDSIINHLWRYEGTVDESGKKLTLEAEGPSMSGDGTMVNYRDAYEFTDDNTIVATSSIQDEDGQWTVFMQGTATRRK